jgi:hypothetical protein
MHRPDLARAKHDALELQIAVLDKLATLITGAFGLVAALAWNGAIQAAFARALGANSSLTVPALTGYALLVTVIAVVATLWIGRVAGRAKAKLAPAGEKLADQSST